MILTEEEVDRVWDASDGRCPFGTHTSLPRHDYGTRWEIVLDIPERRGGVRRIDNMTVICRKHARLKGVLTSDEFTLKLLPFHEQVCGL